MILLFLAVTKTECLPITVNHGLEFHTLCLTVQKNNYGIPKHGVHKPPNKFLISSTPFTFNKNTPFDCVRLGGLAQDKY